MDRMAGRAGPRHGSMSRRADTSSRSRTLRGPAAAVEPSTSDVQGLQSTIGNRALGRLLAPDQRPPAHIARLAADATDATVDALVKGADDDPTFNPLTIVGDLQRAINETDVDADSIYRGKPTRPVDFAVVVRSLEDRTAAQIGTIDAVWKSRHAGRSLRVDLFGGGGSGFQSSLSEHQRSRLEVLMRGTKGGPVPGASAALNALSPEVQAAAAPMLSGMASVSNVAANLNRLEADAIELKELISKGLDDKARVERVMALHRRDLGQIRVMDAFYVQRFSLSLPVHLAESLSGLARQRLAMLREGHTGVADTYAIEAARASAEQQLKDLPEADVFDGVRKGIRNKAMAEVQAIVETNRAEAMEEATSTGNSADAMVSARIGAILNKPAASGVGTLGGALRDTFGAAGAAVAELGESNVITAHARELVAMEEAGTTSTERVAAILTAIREQARVDVRAIAARKTTPADIRAQVNANPEAAVAQLAKQYIGQFRGEYERMPGGRQFASILTSESDANQARLEDLIAGGGEHTSDLMQLDLAIRREDVQAVKAVLRRQADGAAMKLLEANYDRAHVVRLRIVLFGTHLDDDAKAQDLRGQSDNATGAQYAKGFERQAMGGLLSGRDAASAAESLSKPEVMNGAEEVDWIAAQGHNEVAVTMAHRGITADAREWGDDPESQIILETTKGDLGRLAALWHGTNPEDMSRRDTILRVMRKVRMTVSSDATAYEEDNARALEAIRSAVTFAIQIGLAIAIPGAGAGLMAFIQTAAVNIAGSVATNFVVRMGDYGWENLKVDVLGGVLGAGAGKFGEEFLGVVAKTITGDVGRVAAQAANRAGMASKLLREAEEAGFSSAEMAAYRSMAAEAAEKAGLAEAAASTGIAKAGTVFEKGMGMAGNYVASTAATSVYSGQSGFTGEEFGKALVLALAGHLAPSPKGAAPGGEEGGVRQSEPEPTVPHVEEAEAAASEAPSPEALPTDATSPEAGAAERGGPTTAATTGRGQFAAPGEGGGRGAEPPARKPGSVLVARNAVDAMRIYKQWRAESPGHECALLYNRLTGEWAIVQGLGKNVNADPALATLEWQAADVTGARHSHQLESVDGSERQPSGRRGDISEIELDALGEPDGKVWHIIDIDLPGGGTERTSIAYDARTRAFTVDYVDPAAPGGRSRRAFEDLDHYHSWFVDRYGYDPIGTGGLASPGGPSGSAHDTGTVPAELAALAKGEDLASIPDQESHGASMERVAEAQRTLSSRTSKPAERAAALRTVLERTVAETRAYIRANNVGSAELRPGAASEIRLTPDVLRGACGMGADISSDLLASRLASSVDTATIDRVQAAGLDIGARHVFAIVREGPNAYIVDTTFGQFVDPTGTGAPGSTVTASLGTAGSRPEGVGRPGEHRSGAEERSPSVTEEGSSLVTRLLRDGFVELTPETADAYVRALGADDVSAASAVEKLLDGSATVVHDTIQDGTLRRDTTDASQSADPSSFPDLDVFPPIEGPTGGSLRAIDRFLDVLVPEGDPLRPALEEARRTLERLLDVETIDRVRDLPTR